MADVETIKPPTLDPSKFRDPDVTARGAPRAFVDLTSFRTLWFNTGTLCNIECVHCYIESSPTNDQLVYLTHDEVLVYLDEIEQQQFPVQQIGLTGGEPFMNPDCCTIIESALGRGFQVLVLTNSMRPMMRPKVQDALLGILNEYGNRLTLRVSLDHYTEDLHDVERGEGSWAETLVGLKWLSEHGFTINIAGRTCWNEGERATRTGFADLFVRQALQIDAQDPIELVLFPEMDETIDVAEITTECWRLLDVDPNDMMCATSRMVVKRKGAARPAVLACTLLPYDAQFELGTTLVEANGPVKLNHPHCNKFCVLGGGSCRVEA